MSDAAAASTEGQLSAAADEGRGRVFPCARCGADLTFHIGAQSLRCDFCGFTKALTVDEQKPVSENELTAMLEQAAAARQKAHKPVAGTSELHCDTCGANVVFDGTLTSSSCAYCGAPIQRQNVHEASSSRIPVDGVLPFSVEVGPARQSLAAWVRSRWFAPNEFKRRGVDGKLEGVYVPYFTFDAMTSTAFRGQRGDHYWVTVGSGKNRRRERRTRWSSASGWFQRFFDDVLVPALTSLPRDLLIALEPWPLSRCLPFTPDVLAGKLAHTYDVELGPAFAVAKRRIEDALEADVRRRIGGDEQRIESLRTGYAGLTYKHLLLPVWLLAYRFGDKSYRVYVNACTGEVQGERPYSPWKIAFAVLLALIAAGALALFGQQGG